MKSMFARAMIGAGIFFVASLPAFAAQATKVTSASLPSPAQIRASAQAHLIPLNAAPNELFANPDRAYPPSCLNAPLLTLGLSQNDPAQVTGLMTLSGDRYGNTTEQAYTEADTLTIFRVPCSGGTSALLLEIDRPANVDGNFTSYPVFPIVYVTFDDGTSVALRTPKDPNTFLSDNVAGTPVYESSVFVIENTYGSDIQIDFNQAITISVDNLLSGSSEETEAFAMAAYNPANYVAASQPLPITGYETGTWYDTAHNGEGIQTEIGELGTAGTQRFVSVSWYTYDSTGTPYWLIGSGVITVGTDNVWPNTVSVTLAYNSGGGFAGDFGSTATKALWGTIVLNFTDCNTMNFVYQTTGVGIPDTVPTGSGSKTWQRLTQVNGLTCQ